MEEASVYEGRWNLAGLIFGIAAPCPADLSRASWLENLVSLTRGDDGGFLEAGREPPFALGTKSADEGWGILEVLQNWCCPGSTDSEGAGSRIAGPTSG